MRLRLKESRFWWDSWGAVYRDVRDMRLVMDDFGTFPPLAALPSLQIDTLKTGCLLSRLLNLSDASDLLKIFLKRRKADCPILHVGASSTLNFGRPTRLPVLTCCLLH